MIGGYSALAEKLIVSSLCDLLRPHTLRRKSSGLNKHRVGIYEYHHPRNRRDKIAAERFFSPHHPKELVWWCELIDASPAEIRRIVQYCVKNDKDRLYGKRMLRAYFKKISEGN